MNEQAAQLIGAGLAAMGVIGAGIGVGSVWASAIGAIGRNPAAEAKVGKWIWIGFATTEAVAFYALAVAFLVLFH